ncbi:phosphotransferase [Microlunatus sp. Gsoil 973]|uniref:phosphotransferase n=1 Tax=Microlunatus sp. Gsoil 973 TaxID=2672569 RepID=UPI0018A87957|nr:phosphotransferase [Microlunatus sp. Gsoil 973]
MNDRTGASLRLAGLADRGEVGAAYVQWPDGRTGVLTRSAAPVDVIQRTGRLLAGAAAAGLPVPAYQKIVDLGTQRVIIQERLPGSPPDNVDNRLVGDLLDLVDRFTGLGDGGVDLELYLTSSGPGFCLHETLAGHNDRSRRLLARIRAIAAEQPDDRPESGNDLVHLDFHPANVLVDRGRISGLVDWDGVARADRRFALVTLSFDLSIRLRTGTECRGLDGSGVERVVEQLACAAVEDVRRWWAHMSLRQVEWTIRHGYDRAVVDWYETIAERGLDRLDSGRPISARELLD